MTTAPAHLTPYRRGRLAAYAERDAAIEALLRENPNGLTRGQIARCTGLAYEQVDHALNRLERRGVLLCEDRGRVSIYRSE